MINTNVLAKDKGFAFIGWKSYNSIKKKAMEQEFSWSGLVLSLSIAFFIVLASAGALNIFHNSIQTAKDHQRFLNQKIYHLETISHINTQSQAFEVDFEKIIYLDYSLAGFNHRLV